MTKKQPEDTKLLMLSSDLVDRLKAVSLKKGTSLSGYVMEVLEEGLKAESIGATLDAAVNAFKLQEIHKEAGGVMVPRSSLGQTLKSLNEKGVESLSSIWEDAGRWYGRYLLEKLRSVELFSFLRQDLIVSWNLDEVDIIEDEITIFRFIGFMMSEELTRLLISYMHGIMESLGYREIESDSLRGMATIKYIRMKNVE